MPLILMEPVPPPVTPGSLYPSLMMSTFTRTRKYKKIHTRENLTTNCRKSANRLFTKKNNVQTWINQFTS